MMRLMPKGSFRQTEVENAAFGLKQGQRSGIVQTPPIKNSAGRMVSYGGYYIVKAYEVQEGRVVSFEDAQEKIGRILRGKQLDALSAKFSDRLNKESRIKLSPDFIQTTIDEAIKLYWKPQ